MEGFSYVDIFSTKGLEYLLVIGFLVAFVIVWRLLTTRTRAALVAATSGAVAVEPWFYQPDDRHYHQGHTWAMVEGDEVVRVGIDDFAQRLLGTPASVRLPSIGSQLRQGRNGWDLEVRDKPIGVLSPVSGEVVAVNEDVLRHPELVNEDPYGRGWLLRVRTPDGSRSELNNLLSGAVARAWLRETSDLVRSKVAGNLGPVLQDGGRPLSGFVHALAEDGWEALARRWLLVD